MRSIAPDVTDASTLRLVEAVRTIGAELAAREAPEPGAAALQLAEGLGQAIDVLEAALSRLVRRVDDTGAFADLGFSSTGAWLRSRLGMRDGRAAERVRLARHLPRLAQTGKRLAEGTLSAGFAAAITDAVARLDDQDTGVTERVLLDLVEAGHTAGQVARDAAQITEAINQHRGKEKEPEDSRRGSRRSWATKTKALDGCSWVKWFLTPEHTAAFEQIIGPLAKPRAKGDDRDLAQRTADALMSVLTEGNKNAGVTVIVDLAAFAATTDDTGPFTAATSSGSQEAAPRRSRDSSPSSDTGPSPSDGTGASDSDLRGERDGSSEGNRNVASDSTAHPWDTSADLAATGRLGVGDSAEDGGSEGGGNDGGLTNGLVATMTDRASPRSADPGHANRPAGHANRPAGHANRPVDQAHGLAGHANSPASQANRPAGPMNGPAGDANGTDRGADGLEAHMRRRGRVAARSLNGTPISPERARQIALNAGINVLILGRSGLPLYLGRTVRFATPAQRKALLALYGTCCVQGCQIPAHLSEIHHLGGGWKLATPTDIDRLAPACGWHNRWIEEHADQVEETRDDQGRAVLRILTPWERQAASHAA